MMKGILWGGLIAGILDISDAFIYVKLRGGSPIRVLYYISSALIGKDALQGGVAMAALGMSLHFLIAYSAAVTYYIVSIRMLPALGRHPVPWGLCFGLLWYGLMNYIVLPLAHMPPGKFSWVGLINGVCAIVFLVGLPIALIARRFN